jgi:hypothetical protein
MCDVACKPPIYKGIFPSIPPPKPQQVLALSECHAYSVAMWEKVDISVKKWVY